MPDERRVFAGVSGSPGSVHALRHAADLARRHDAILIPLLAWVPPDSNRLPWPELRQIWDDDAWQRLWDTLDTAFGGLPAGIATQPVVRRGKPGQVLTGAARQPGDVLVIGTGRRSLRRRLGRCRVARYCLAHACCPVLAIPPPALAQEAGYGLRGWARRRRWAKATAPPAPGPPTLLHGAGLPAAANTTPADPSRAHTSKGHAMSRIRRIGRSLARLTGPPGTPEPWASRPTPPAALRAGRYGPGGFAGGFLQDVAAAAGVAAGHQLARPGHGSRPAVGGGWPARSPSAAPGATLAKWNWPLATIIRSRRRTVIVPRLWPRTVQLCLHCRHHPAGFWVSHTIDQTARRPWCLSCCQQLDQGRYHMIPFDSLSDTGRYR